MFNVICTCTNYNKQQQSSKKNGDAANNTTPVYKRTGNTGHKDYKITAVPVKEKNVDEKKSIEPSETISFRQVERKSKEGVL
jgi:hypothetical protein